MDKSMYFSYATAVYEKLREKVNGYVKYKVYADIDAIIFKFVFKDFHFEYAINNIQDKIYAGDSELVADGIMHAYKTEVFNAFFKRAKKKEAYV